MERSDPAPDRGTARPRKTLMRKALSFSAAIMCAAAVISAVLGYATWRQSALRQAKEYLGSFAAELVSRENDLLGMASKNRSALLRSLEDAMEKTDRSAAKAEFARRAVRFPDGSWRSMLVSFDGTRMAGVYVSPEAMLDDEAMAMVAAAARLCESSGIADSGIVERLFVFRPDGILVMYWPACPDWCFKVDSGFRLQDQEFAIAAATAEREGRAAGWTGMYLDPQSRGLSVSCAGPLPSRGGGAAIMAGFGLSMGSFTRRITGSSPEGSTSIVFDRGGRIIAHSGMSAAVWASGGKLTLGDAGDAWLESVDRDALKGEGDGTTMLDPTGSALVGVGRIEGPDWLYVIRTPLSPLSMEALRSGAAILALCMAAIVIACAFLFFVLRSRVEEPIKRLADAVDAIAEGDLGIPIPSDSGDELWRFAASLEAMRKRLMRVSGEIMAFFDQTPAPICLTRLSDGSILAANGIFAEFFGRSKSEISSRTLIDLGVFASKDDMDKYVRLSRESGESREFIVKLGSEGGAVRELMLSSRMITHRDEECLLTAIADLGPVRKAEAALRESEERMRLFMEKRDDGILVVDETGAVVFWNAAAIEITGIPAEEAIGKPWAVTAFRLVPSALRTPGYFAQMSSMIASILDGKTPIPDKPREFAIERLDGKARLVEQRVHEIVSNGRRLLYTGLRDITERRLLEEQYRQAQKMESVGRLARGVAHGYNNLLTAVIGNIELAKSAMADEAKAKSYLDIALRASESGAALTRRLQAFSRKQPAAPVPIDLGSALADLRSMMERLVGADIEVRIETPPGLWPIKLDPGQLDQVVMNLAVNAKDAMGTRGELALTASNVEVDSSQASLLGSRPGPYVRLSVSDTGSGMSEEVKSHLFEPFFTTKPEDSGSGLGLTTVYGIVAQCGGHIDVVSEPDKGSEFILYFPRCDETPAVSGEAAAEPEEDDLSAPSGETVFIAEDEEILRELAKESLEQRGYRAFAFSDGASLLRAARGERIDVLFTDVVMPGMNGRQLAEALAPDHPEMRVIYCSGYMTDDSGEDAGIEPGADFIAKPYKPADMLRLVGKALAGRNGSGTPGPRLS